MGTNKREYPLEGCLWRTHTKPHQNGGDNTGVSTSSRGGGGGSSSSGGGSSSSSSSSSSNSSTRIHECMVLLFMHVDDMASALTPQIEI